MVECPRIGPRRAKLQVDSGPGRGHRPLFMVLARLSGDPLGKSRPQSGRFSCILRSAGQNKIPTRSIIFGNTP